MTDKKWEFKIGWDILKNDKYHIGGKKYTRELPLDDWQDFAYYFDDNSMKSKTTNINYLPGGNGVYLESSLIFLGDSADEQKS